ncbi:MAG: hypothetical protein WD738_05550 [Pirellulales bacterium]
MFATCNWAKSIASGSLLVIASCVAMFTFTGCERKERVLDLQTPAGDVEVDRNIDTGEVEVDVNDQ